MEFSLNVFCQKV